MPYDQGQIHATLSEFVRQAGGLGREAADIAGALDDLGAINRSQSEAFDKLFEDIRGMVSSNQSISHEAREAETLAGQTRGRVESALAETRMLASAVSRVEEGISSVGVALKQVARAADEIGQIAFQTRIVAFNASVEAVRAGEAGKGFGVVADAVKDLAQRVQSSSQLISNTVSQLDQRVEALAKEVEAEHGGKQGGAEAAVDAAIEAFRSAFGAVAAKIHHISSQADGNLTACDNVLNAVQALDKDVETSSRTLEASRGRAHALLGLSENLIEITTHSGLETEDSPYISAVVEAANEIGLLFEDAVDDGRISLNDLFDENYLPVAGSNPAQQTTRYLRLSDAVLPPIQESMLNVSPQVVFCAAIDRNGYLPTHNLKFSKPQGRNPEWNAANCRNRRIFNDRTGLAAGRNEKPFLLQTYRRDMGGGKHVLMKDLSAPIYIKGRHWGGLRLGYRFE
ncbi:MAG: methyl-accepting chemotaxis protein [Pseudomonadota bacterium]|nr:methyl-accepting chemotaxis protein [Pseudomonadota bacterium]MDP1572986.1 methyl-accepting chemotaxis protein [Pseudomonadota bacterium]MDP1903144.1 methyl-accepting chemotaxis protein [Pseudomonadota bacterium]